MELTQSQNKILVDVINDVEAIMGIYQKQLSIIGAAHFNLTSLFQNTISYQILDGDMSKVSSMTDKEFMNFLYEVVYQTLEEYNEI